MRARTVPRRGRRAIRSKGAPHRRPRNLSPIKENDMTTPSKWGNQLRLDGDIGSAYDTEVAALADGRFVATWVFTTATGQQQVHGQLFDADGSRKGTEFFLPGAGHRADAAVTALTNGGFALAWQEFTTGTLRLLAQTFDVDGNATSAPFFVSDTSLDEEQHVQLATRPGGGFAATWWSQDHSGQDRDVMLRLFGADGRAGGRHAAARDRRNIGRVLSGGRDAGRRARRCHVD
jgi:hypothetical protein